MRNTLKNINTVVRDILHELGVARVNTQVDSKEIHVLTFKGKWERNTGRPFIHLVEMRTEVKMGYNKKDVLCPMVTVGFQRKDCYKGRFEQWMSGSYQSQNFFFKNKEDLKNKMIDFFEENLLFRYFKKEAVQKTKEPAKRVFNSGEEKEANKVLRKGYMVTIHYPERVEQLDLFASSADNK